MYFVSSLCGCPADGSDSRDKPKLYRLQHSVTEVGSDRGEDGNIQVREPLKLTSQEHRVTGQVIKYNFPCLFFLHSCLGLAFCLTTVTLCMRTGW